MKRVTRAPSCCCDDLRLQSRRRRIHGRTTTQASGVSFLGMCFPLASMVIQVTLAMVSGMGPYVSQDGTTAAVLVLSVAAVKLLWAAVLIWHAPCLCLLTNVRKSTTTPNPEVTWCPSVRQCMHWSSTGPPPFRP